MARGPSTKPVSSEELECWAHAAAALRAYNSIYTAPQNAETIGRVNRLISTWPTDDNLPADGYEGLKSLYKKISSGLNDIKAQAEAEAKAIDEALDHLDMLLALRKASELAPPEKPAKRPRIRSPSHTPAPQPAPMPLAPKPSVSITLPARPPQAIIPFSRDARSRREALADQLPLQPGRKVAFHPPEANADSENTWIMAIITECINQDKNRYRVQDPEPQENGSPGLHYNTTLKQIIPLPDPHVPPNNPAHLNAYQVFEKGSTVMALYPDTSTFYRAHVLSNARDLQQIQPGDSKKPMYKLKFEDDEDQEHLISAEWVVEWPNGR